MSSEHRPRKVTVSVYRPSRSATQAEIDGLPCKNGKRRRSKVRPNKKPGGPPRVQTSVYWLLTRIDGVRVGRYCFSTGTSNKTEAKNIAADLQVRLLRGETGLEDQYRGHRTRPITEHLRDYIQSLRDNPDNLSEDYIKQTENRLRELLTLANVGVADDLRYDSISRAIGRLKAEGRPNAKKKVGLAPNTLNSYRTSVVAFAGWLVSARRLASHELNALKKADAERDKRRPRRALTEDEFNKLLKAAMQGPVIERCSGPERAMAYLLISHTTWRRRAIQALQVKDLTLDGDEPFASLPEWKNKSKREIPVQPLRKDVAEVIASFVKSRGLWPDDQLVPRFSKHASSDGIRADLEAAGVPHRDAKGAFADYHALRGRANTIMATQGVPVAVRQAVLGVSDPKLVAHTYNYAQVAERRAALEKLPPLPPLDFSGASA